MSRFVSFMCKVGVACAYATCPALFAFFLPLFITGFFAFWIKIGMITSWCLVYAIYHTILR